MDINNLIMLNNFSNETIKAFEKLFYYQSVIKEEIEIKDNCYIIRVGINGAFDAFLVLENASGLPDGEEYSLNFDEKIEKQGDEYVLFGTSNDYTEDFDLTTQIPFEIRFTDVSVKTKIYKIKSEGVASCSWYNLCSIAFEIVEKYLFSQELLNEAEMNNLPLIIELANLLSYSDYKNEARVCEYPILKQYFSKHHFDKALKKFAKIENESNSEKLCELKEHFLEKLDVKKYETLFRELLEIVSNTQNGYKTRVECCCPFEKLLETRKQIDSLIKAKGYEGEYPFYYKEGRVKGVKIKAVDYYPKKFFAFVNQKMMHYIYCKENDFENDSLFIDFYCGCEAIKGSAQKPDLISFMFNSNGKPYYENVDYSYFYDENSKLISEDLEQKINIATKLAELKKLSKAERKEYISAFNLKAELAMLPISILFSLVLSLIVLFGFMLLGVLLCLVFGLSSEIPSMFHDIPWLRLYFLSTGLIEIIFIIYILFI